jgi:hypothetical protein
MEDDMEVEITENKEHHNFFTNGLHRVKDGVVEVPKKFKQAIHKVFELTINNNGVHKVFELTINNIW